MKLLEAEPHEKKQGITHNELRYHIRLRRSLREFFHHSLPLPKLWDHIRCRRCFLLPDEPSRGRVRWRILEECLWLQRDQIDLWLDVEKAWLRKSLTLLVGSQRKDWILSDELDLRGDWLEMENRIETKAKLGDWERRAKRHRGIWLKLANVSAVACCSEYCWSFTICSRCLKSRELEWERRERGESSSERAGQTVPEPSCIHDLTPSVHPYLLQSQSFVLPFSVFNFSSIQIPHLILTSSPSL